jgi:hypothetical protein
MGRRLGVILNLVGAPSVVTVITGVGLAEHMALVDRGPHAGRVFVPEVRPAGGAFITTIDIGAGTGVKGVSYALADGFDNIPYSVSVQR